MCVNLSAVLLKTVLFLIINLSSISAAQHHRYPRYFAQRNHRALQIPSHFKDTVSLKVYYESQCPGSVKFFKEQLAPSLERLGRHLNVHMIPYGHARTDYENGRYTFECQHGDIECYGNMLHASAIDVARNNTRAALFNACIMERTNDYNTLNYLVNWCGYQYNISANAIWETMNTGRASFLLKGYGDETHALRPRYVPYVVLDGAVADAVTTNHLGYFACSLLNPRLSVCDAAIYSAILYKTTGTKRLRYDLDTYIPYVVLMLDGTTTDYVTIHHLGYGLHTAESKTERVRARTYARYMLDRAVSVSVTTITSLRVDLSKVLEWYKPRNYEIANKGDKVDLRIYYEAMCPYCIDEYTEILPEIIDKLGAYINLKTYPYGNSNKTEKNGKTVIECQHGPKECYGNKLHACAIDVLKDTTQYVKYIACMMSGQEDGSGGSNDKGATECGKQMGIDATKIIECAKGEKGEKLLEQYGEETDYEAPDKRGVPWSLINGKFVSSDLWFTTICAALAHPPPECK
ncbi:uncharacterized protein LOC125225227 [Leguminivora glycinivorella]|uniref:uncharacterized protein LOC125225227 n=1 Tax=Leguminivora glycinivorella TaxID=1035111 RepID=UPI00200BF606|nr:uncharacterized protein LOC125225227 [Leguminivora glycinivorella]